MSVRDDLPPTTNEAARVLARAYRDDRDRWIRLYNRLEAAITHHQKATEEPWPQDEALYAARDRVNRDAGGDR